MNELSPEEVMEAKEEWPWHQPIQCQRRVNSFPVVFGQNGCVHRVQRSILSQKRLGGPSRSRNFAAKFGIFDFFSDYFGHFRV